MLTTGSVIDMGKNITISIVDSVMFCFCILLLVILGIYIFIIFPHKAKTIKNQKLQINKLDNENKRLKKKIVITK